MQQTSHAVTLRQLQYLVAVAKLRNFRQAAAACHVSQPSLSAQLAQAEQALGVQWFERDRRRVQLTRAGAELLVYAERTLMAAEALRDAAQGLADPFARTVRLGIIPTMAPYLLPELAPALRAAYPKLSVLWSEAKTASLVEQLNHGDLDGAILAQDTDVAGFSHIVLGNDPFVLAAAPGHPLTRGRGRLAPKALANISVLLLDDGHCFRSQAFAFCAGVGAREAAYRATSLSTLVQMTVSNLGVTLLPQMAIAVENRHGDLQLRPVGPPVPGRTVVLVWRPGSALMSTFRGLGATLNQSYRRRYFTKMTSPAGPSSAMVPSSAIVTQSPPVTPGGKRGVATNGQA